MNQSKCLTLDKALSALIALKGLGLLCLSAANKLMSQTVAISCCYPGQCQSQDSPYQLINNILLVKHNVTRVDC